MAPTDETIQSDALDREIEGVKAESKCTHLNDQRGDQHNAVAQLKFRRSFLQHSLRSHPKVREILISARSNESSPTKRAAIDQALADINEQDITSLYRTVTGLTTFRAKDPNPHAVDDGNVLGIRIEHWNSREKGFSNPYYVFLVKPWKASEAYRVHKHTIPAFVDLRALEVKFLPEPSVAGRVSKQRVKPFARAVRRALVKELRKREMSPE